MVDLRRRLVARALLAGLLAALVPHSVAAPPQAARAYVTGVADGDTCYATIDGSSVAVRLAFIDAPEKSQAFGRRSEASLRELVWKRWVDLRWSGLDRYQRLIAQVSVDGHDINAEQVRRGMAWVYTQYAKDRPDLLQIEKDAREQRRGLWQDTAPVPPWEYRRSAR